MKHFHYIILLVVLPLLSTGCKKYEPTTIFDFSVKISRIEAHRVWADVYPKDEFLKYYMDWMTVDDFNENYATDEMYIQEFTDIYTAEQISKLSHEGAWMGALQTHPSASYYLLIMQIDGNKPINLRKVKFHSGEEHSSSFSLVADSIQLDAEGVLSIHPADTSWTYFWDIALNKEIRTDWADFHSVWFYYDVLYYYSMDFFPDALTKGTDERNLLYEYHPYELTQGDTISILAVGYDTMGETSPAYMPFWLIYPGEGSCAVAIPADSDEYEDLFMVDE